MSHAAELHEPRPEQNVASERPLFCDAGALRDQDHPTSVWARLAKTTSMPDPFSAGTPWQFAFRQSHDPRRCAIVRACADGLVQFAQHRMTGSTDHILGPFERLWISGCNLLGPSAHHLLTDLVGEIGKMPEKKIRGLVIGGLAPDDMRLRFLRSALADRKPRLLRRDVLCAAWLDGGVEGFLSRRSANFRRNIRRQSRITKMAGIVFETIENTHQQDIDAVYARMQAVERVSWKGLTHQGMNAPSPRRFYHALLRRLAARGDARIILATREGTDIGFIFGGMCDSPDGRVYRGQQFSFDARYQALSIGNLLQMRQIAALCTEGAARYDMGTIVGRSMRYKHHWAEHLMLSEAWRFDL